MFARLLLLFIAVPMIELYLLVEIGGQIGLGLTFATVILTGILGATLTKQQGLKTLREAQLKVQAGGMPTDSMVDGLLILLAGGVLLTPGFLTDTAGFLLLVPPVRKIIRESIKGKLLTHVNINIRSGHSMNENSTNQNSTNQNSTGYSPFDPPPGANSTGFKPAGYKPQGFKAKPKSINPQNIGSNKPGAKKPDIVVPPKED